MGANRAWRVVAAVAAVVVGGLAAAAWGQCEPEWLSGPDQGVAGVDGTVRAMTRWDPDGDGPLEEWLVIGGRFTIAGDTAANNIVAWDGERFHRLGGGFDSAGENGVTALTVYDGELIAGGQLYKAEGQSTPGVAAWNGVNWRPVSEAGQPVNSIGGGEVRALTVYNGELVAAGRFGQMNRTNVDSIARWDGASWHAFDVAIDGEINALLVRDGELIFGGLFWSVNGMPARHVARWDGTNCTPILGERFLQSVHSLGEYNGDLIAGTYSGALRWNGGDWEPFGSNWHGRPVYAMLVHAGGLIVTGSDLMILNNGTWELFGNTGGQIYQVYALGSVGGEVVVGGSFTQARGVRSRGLIRYNEADGGGWRRFGSGFDNYIEHAGTYAGELIVAGPFGRIGDLEVHGMARWDGATWRPLTPTGRPNSADAIIEHGGRLFVGGEVGLSGDWTGELARWEGDAWTTLLSVPGGHVAALLSTPEGLIVGGTFAAVGEVPAANIARLDDAGNWHAVGDGFDADVAALTLYNGDLVAAGSFIQSGEVHLDGIARWDGQSWQAIGAFPGGAVRALAVHSGELIAGGLFSFEGGDTALAAAWDGAMWRPMPGGAAGERVIDFAALDGRLFAATSRPLPAPNEFLREWDGTAWGVPDEQPNYVVRDLTSFDGELIVLGRFTTVGDVGSAYWARYGSPPSPLCPADTDCDSVLTAMDVAAYVQFWFARDARAERTGDAPVAIDVFDLLSYLGEWFGGC